MNLHTVSSSHCFVPPLPLRLPPLHRPVLSSCHRCQLRSCVTPSQPRTPSLRDEASRLSRHLQTLQTRITTHTQNTDLQLHESAIRELQAQSSSTTFWEDADAARATLRQLSEHEEAVNRVKSWATMTEEVQALIQLAEEMVEEGLRDDGEQLVEEAGEVVKTLETDLETFELERLLDGKFDSLDATLMITAGAGGTDAQDWAEMLSRMYRRWAQRKGFTVSLLEGSVGDEAGLKSVTLEICGRNAYGFLRGEKGTHRLVRISPFNTLGKRQTSFAGVEVMPVLEEGCEEEDVGEVEVTTMRSGGKGGQNVNKVESAVRIVHVETGISVKCDRERSQLMNRNKAMDMLKARLAVLREEERLKEVAKIRGEMVEAGWGSQIRNYVLHPYRLVKDLRTGEERNDSDSVLDGEIDSFIQALLRHRHKQQQQQTQTNH